MQQPLIEGMHHVCIRVPDLKKTVAFYTETLGFGVYLQWETGAMLRLPDGAILEVFAQKTPGEPLGLRHIALRAADPDAAFRAALAAGCAPLVEPKDIVIEAGRPLHARIAFFLDPCGNEIELFCEKQEPDFVEEKDRILLKDAGGKTVAEVDFPENADGVPEITHTFVDSSLRGRGIAGKLMEKTAAKLRRDGKKAVATCSYAVGWFQKHPEENDVLK